MLAEVWLRQQEYCGGRDRKEGCPKGAGYCVREYRVYHLDASGHVKRRDEFFCVDDEAAKDQAKRLIDGNDIELWNLGRFVAVIKRPQ